MIPAAAAPTFIESLTQALRDLKLSDKELLKALGSRVNDYLKNVKQGKQTLLNSKRWRFASFFNRVKRQVAQNWHPDVVYRRRDPTGRAYGVKDRYTLLRVTLDDEGKIKRLLTTRNSGLDFMDADTEWRGARFERDQELR